MSEREDVISEDGVITFNYLQQADPLRDPPDEPATPLEEAGTTDPDGITTG